jgi:phthalate 4,5-dioxygenase oxygenase subunit
MLSLSDNELLTRVGPGTPMGELMRQYWVPALPSTEFPAPDSPPKRMKLLGENLIMFRDSEGRVGCFKEACPHRGASLFFGRNEESGLRCVYHGWKFDVTGACVDMPSEPAESNFKNKVRVRSYPARDVNHMVWVYMGDRELLPPFPAFEINTLPPEQVSPPGIMMEESNWLQNLEGDLDSNHLDYLHSRLDAFRLRMYGEQPAEPAGVGLFNAIWSDKIPRLDVQTRECGVFYSARRTWDVDPRYEWHRINQFIFPFHTMITGSDGPSLRSFVPLDDEWAMLITQRSSLTQAIYDPTRPVQDPFAAAGGYVERTSNPTSYFYTKANKHNDYSRDYEAERTRLVCGVPPVGNLQDRAMTELMSNEKGEVIYDRSHEHLGTLDVMVITVRKQLLKAVKALRDSGVAPPNVEDQSLNRIRHATVILPHGADWVKETERVRDSESGLPVAWEMKPFDKTEVAVALEAVAGGGGGS